MGKSLYNSTLRLAVFDMLILTSFFLFNACSKDKEFTDPPIQLRNDALSTILSKINFDQNGNILLGSGSTQVTLQHASIEYQREVSDYIFDNLSFSRIDSMREMYGLPVWELAIINKGLKNNENYIFYLPLVENNILSGYIYFEKFNGLKKGLLITNEKIIKIVTETDQEISYYDKWVEFVSYYNIFSFLINPTLKNQIANNWLIKAINGINSNNISISLRDAELPCDCGDCEYYTQYMYSDGTIIVVYRCKKHGGCGSSGNNGGGDFNGYFGDDDLGNDWDDGDDFGNGSSGGGGTGKYGDSNDKNLKEDLELKLLCGNKVADFMAKTKVRDLIANNNLTDPCDPTKSSAELLQKALEGYCVNKKGAVTLNLEDAEHFMGEILVGFDNIINEIKNNKINCIYNKFNDIDDKLFCNSIQNFFGDTPIKLQFIQKDLGGGIIAETKPDYNGYQVTITLNEGLFDYYCEIVFYTQFLHEGIHAEIYRQNIDGFHGINYEKNEIWNLWDNNASHHNNIANEYIPYIVATLKAEYGDRYSDIEYEALAWLGLGNVGNSSNYPPEKNTIAWNNLSPGKQKQLQDAFYSAAHNNCEQDECK